MLNHVSKVLSIWEVAHRWYNKDPNKYQNDNVPLNVQDLLRVFTKALFRHEMQLCKGRTPQWNYSLQIDWYSFKIKHCALPERFVFQDFEIICMPDIEYLQNVFKDTSNIHCEVYEIDPTSIPATNTERCCCYTGLGEKQKEDSYKRHEEYSKRRSQYHIEKTKDLKKCFISRIFIKELLDDIYIDEVEVAKFCKNNGEKLPEFWFGKPGTEHYDYYQNRFIDVIDKNVKSTRLVIEGGHCLSSTARKKLELIIYAANDALEHEWGDYVHADKSTWRTGKQVTDYLLNKYGDKLNVNDRKSIQVAIRPPKTVLTGKKGLCL